MAAKRAYRRHDLRNALQCCQELARVDPLCQTAGFVYVSTLVALKHKRELFRLAHEWVDAAPKSAKAWFAVGASLPFGQLGSNQQPRGLLRFEDFRQCKQKRHPHGVPFLVWRARKDSNLRPPGS